METATDTLRERFLDLLSTEGIDPGTVEVVATQVAEMPSDTHHEIEQQLIAWVTILRTLRALQLKDLHL